MTVTSTKICIVNKQSAWQLYSLSETY